jgi:RNA exonuclease 4
MEGEQTLLKNKRKLSSEEISISTENEVVSLEDSENFKYLQILKNKEKKASLQHEITKRLSFDCEMVEIDKLHSALARISIVNYKGDTLIDIICKPNGVITDYREHITGLKESDFIDAMPFSQCREMVIQLFKNRILIGHSVSNDFLALNYSHPKSQIRDTSKFKQFQKSNNQPLSLKNLTLKHFNITIQDNNHDSIEDARAALCLFQKYEKEIEKELFNKNHKLVRKKLLEDAKKLKSLFGV